MITNQGAWPKSWEELHDDYHTCVERSGQPWTFEELRNRVVVDWTADPGELTESARKADERRFRVIWLRDGTNAHWESHEPNQIIYEYLRQEAPHAEE